MESIPNSCYMSAAIKGVVVGDVVVEKLDLAEFVIFSANPASARPLNQCYTHVDRLALGVLPVLIGSVVFIILPRKYLDSDHRK